MFEAMNHKWETLPQNTQSNVKIGLGIVAVAILAGIVICEICKKKREGEEPNPAISQNGILQIVEEWRW